ncbi:hypothetical protein Taro_016235 [Colocasia esculenta]|uniref:DNA repair metallo-beta-lactamase domain-containing protein n=1 Tax=Colocasia esculenta TaxID=4460 RepID=A0A843UPP0_COLES|nr:hypothetical protein [Colocasia esculenta]
MAAKTHGTIPSHDEVFEGFPRLYERASAKVAQARASIQPEPLFIRPSAQWYACDDSSDTERPKITLSEAVRDEFGVWHVCYTMHSSRNELEWALQLLRPKWVISTTPPCRAMELSYVKDHCFKTQVNTDDPIWRLFGVGAEKSAPVAVSLVSEVAVTASSSSIVEETTATEGGCIQLQMKNKSLVWDMPPRIDRPLTLFGRARLGTQDLSTPADGKIVISTITGMETPSTSSIQGGVIQGKIVHLQEATVSDQVPSFQEDDDASDLQVEKSDGGESEVKRGSSSVGSSAVYNDSLRRLYRSMNVPVPKPLPSLVALMETNGDGLPRPEKPATPADMEQISGDTADADRTVQEESWKLRAETGKQ